VSSSSYDADEYDESNGDEDDDVMKVKVNEVHLSSLSDLMVHRPYRKNLHSSSTK